MSRNNFLLYIAFFAIIAGNAQVSKADRLFKKGDFIKAAELYEKALSKTRTQHILQQLTDCYYNTYQYDQGIVAMKALESGDFTNPEGTYDARYNFMYYQFLSATGDYEKAIDQLVAYKQKMGQPAPDVAASKEMVETFRLKKADFEIEKVDFNSDASDYAAVQQNDLVYFSSDRENGDSSFKNTFKKDYKWTHRPFLDLYAIAVDAEGKGVGEASALKSINSALHEGAVCFSNDGKTMYISRSNLVNGKRIFNDEDKNQVQLYVSKKSGDSWSEPKKLSFCSDAYNYQHPSLSQDGRTLFYSSDAQGSLGSYDIFSVALDENGGFGTPQNLGAVVNTPEREQYPYISAEGHLFFASNGHLGLGLLDIFVARLEDGAYSTPINLGAPINSQYDDISLSYSSAENGFFSSNRDSGNDDIFAFKQIAEIFTREYVNLFEIKDSINGAPVPNATVKLMNADGEVEYENTLDEEGQFTANLIPGEYTLEIESVGFGTTTQKITIDAVNNDKHDIAVKKLFDADQIVQDNTEESKKIIADLLQDQRDPKISSVDGKLYFDIPYIYFDFDRWEIRADSKILLDNLIAKLKDYPTLKIRINSHTDNRGTDRYNQVLSEKRAQSSRDYLVKIGGLDASRISFKGYGEAKPLIVCDDECSKEQHQKNRRSEFQLVEY